MPAAPGAGPFHGLAPFAERDEQLFFGRDAEISRLRTLLSSSDRQAILVTGELGIGKTSLLLAGLLPTAQRLEYDALYVEIGTDWEERLRQELARFYGRPLEPGDATAAVLAQIAETRQKMLLVVFDQLEQLTWLSPHEQKSLENVIARLTDDGVAARAVYCVNRASLHVLGRVLGRKARIPDSHRVALARFDVEQAAAVIEQTVLAGGGYMEAGLPRLIAEELAEGASGTTPAELQRVCHAAVCEHALTLKRYRRAGGASVLGSLYVERLAAQVGGWSAKRMLAVMVESDNPRAVYTREEIAAGAGLALGPAAKLLDQLTEVGLVRKIEIAGRRQHFSILHSALGQAIRDLIAPVRRGRARARLALRKRIDGGPLRPAELITIGRYLGRSVTDRELTKIQRSKRLWIMVAVLVAALPFVVYGLIFLRLNSNYYLAVAPDRAGTPRVVVKSGDPALSFAFGWTAPGFGELQLDTGIALASLPPTLQKITDEHVVGPLLSQKKGVPVWLERLWGELPAARRGALMVLAGRQKAGVDLLFNASKKADSRRLALRLLVLLRGDSNEVRQALLAALKDERPSIRALAVRRALRLGSGTKLAVLERAVVDVDASVRLFAVHALSGTDEQAALPLWLGRLDDGDVRVQKAALGKLQQVSKKKPALVVEAVTEALLSLTTKSVQSRLRPIVPQLEQLQHDLVARSPKRLARYLVTSLGRGGSPARQVAVLHRLRGLLRHVDPGRALPLLDKLRQSKQQTVRVEATALWARFADPNGAMDELRRLSRVYRPRREGVAMRRAAAIGLGYCRAPVKDRIKLLKLLLNDPSRKVRRAAVAAMLAVGPGSLHEITQRMRRGFVDIGRAALDAVCRGPSRLQGRGARTVVAVVLSAAWAVRGGILRPQALGCAQTLAKASPRLSMWLSDQALVSKDAAMRRAAAPAVAMALERSGHRLARLARYYLADKNAAVREAVLTEIAKRPPAQPAFLWRFVEPLTRDGENGIRAAAAPLVMVCSPGERGAKTLVRLLDDRDPTVSEAAVAALGKVEPNRLAGRARAVLDSAVGRVVVRASSEPALRALAVAKKLALGEPFLRAATHPDARVRAVAIEALSRSGSAKGTLQVLAAAQRDREPALRRAAIRAISRESKRLGDPAVSLLVRSIDAPDFSERWAAFEALGNVEGVAAEKAVALLARQAGHRSEERRRMATRALGKLASRVEAAAKALQAGTQDPALDVRDEARAALAAVWGRTRPADMLWKLLSTSLKDGVNRRTAVAALAFFGRERDPEWLGKKVKAIDQLDPTVRMAARLALRLGRGHATPSTVLSDLYGR